MNLKINMQAFAEKKILVAPLDWGLGHATRCIPIIDLLLKNNCSIWLAGEGEEVVLLSKEYPGLPILHLKGYRVNYAASGMIGKILWQVPKILKSINDETKWLKSQIEKHHFDFVISDNRYGLHHSKAHSIFITHQLNIKTPFGKWGNNFLQYWNYKFISRFNECWVPDEEGEFNFAGELSHPVKTPHIPIKYIGTLSRLEKKHVEEIKNHLLFVISGPEPQRSLLEKKIVEQIAGYNGTATVIRGLPSSSEVLPSSENIVFYNHISSEQMNEEMSKAEFVISRSGYSTIMDIAALKKKSVLIPTPAQTEQEYLANYLMKKQFAYCVSQKEFSLLQSIEKAKAFHYSFYVQSKI